MKILLITSLKGGVGKSTIAANLASCLAKRGKNVLLCDLDFYTRSLDLILGLENLVIYDICDVLAGRIPYQSARLIDKRSNFAFLGAPFSYRDHLTPEEFSHRIKALGEENRFDYIVLDTPGSDTLPLSLATSAADTALIAATHNPASVRGAQKTAELMEEAGISTRLIINHFDYASVKERRRIGINDTIDKTRCRLIGVIPYDPEMSRAQESGILADESSPLSSRAFDNIAQRIIAEETGARPAPLLKGVKSIKRKKILTK